MLDYKESDRSNNISHGYHWKPWRHWKHGNPLAMSIVRKNKRLALRKRFLWIVALLAEVANKNRAHANKDVAAKQAQEAKLAPRINKVT